MKTTRYRKIIREVIERRIRHGEPLTVPSIRDEAGGGSYTTILDEVHLATQRLTADELPGAGDLTAYERVKILSARIRELGDQNDSLKASLIERDRTIESLRAVIDAASGPKGVLLDRVMRLEETIRVRDARSIEELERLVGRAAEIVERMPREGIKRVVESDPLLEGRYQVLVADHAKLISRYQRLAGAYFEETGKDPDDVR